MFYYLIFNLINYEFKFPFVQFIKTKMFVNNPDIDIDEDNELILVNDFGYMEEMQKIFVEYSANKKRFINNFTMKLSNKK